MFDVGLTLLCRTVVVMRMADTASAKVFCATGVCKDIPVAP